MSATQTQSAPAQTKPSITAVTVLPTEELPTQSAVDEAAAFTVLDAQGKEHRFDSLHAKPGQRTLVIFVRHFYCGMCQDFLQSLCASVTPATLASAPRPTSLVIVGCGDPTLIDEYVQRTGCHFPVYADPTRKLYSTLGMITTLSLGPKKPNYQHTPLMDTITRSFLAAWAAGPVTFFTKAGRMNQVGGDFLFEDGRVTWCHRMQNTRDHTEIGDLRALLEVPSEG